ncbi:MAG: hypothetical protein ATN33_05300 [Epulopiscium sp. Nele67-Bin001]|nr:MAG: hypothetical protein BEN18_08285 [Epulopiscium sp. Nuni2H_MBin001]OON93768.1 MAG: hypothetical protein ATN33_05300 [Epulopiscium sp. Nele67-Bin001]
MVDKVIRSTNNTIIKNVQLLQKKKALRKKQGMFVVEGLRAVTDISDDVCYYIATSNINKLDVTSSATQWITVADDVFASVSETKSPQGILAVVKTERLNLEDIARKSFYLVLENVQDPGNMGTIIRTAYGFGVEALIVSTGCVDIYSPKVVRATMSAITKLPIVYDVEIAECMEFLRENGTRIYATDLEAAHDINDVRFSKNLALVVGNEANGISEFTRDIADEKVKIVIANNLESLNVAVATGICLYKVTNR